MNFQTESRLWHLEVDDEAASLVRDGMQPSQAYAAAVRIVKARRERDAQNRTLAELAQRFAKETDR